MAVDVLSVIEPDRTRQPIPRWASWFVDAGVWLWTQRGPSWSPVLVVTVPARQHAALFAALGLLIAVRATAPSSDDHAALERLRILVPGTPVRFRQGNSVRTGEFVCVLWRDGEPYVEIRAGRTTYLEPASRAPTIDPLSEGQRASGRARAVGRAAGLIHDVLGIDPVVFETTSSVDVVIVGPKERLLEEALLELRQSRASGRLSDLLRPRGLVRSAEAHRTELRAGSSHPDQSILGSAASAVLDGPQAVIHYLEVLTGRPVFVIIDRTDPSVGDAVAAMASHRATLADVLDVSGLAAQPGGIEVVAYRKRAL